MYSLKILTQAEKDLGALHGKLFNNLKRKIELLSGDPRPFGCTKLTNEEGYRIRVGDYRILYRIDDGSKEIFIYRIKHRREVYR